MPRFLLVLAIAACGRPPAPISISNATPVEPARPAPLTPAQIEAASANARDHLPPVAQDELGECGSLLDAGNRGDIASLAAAATCYRRAGALGAAVKLWLTIVRDYPETAEAIEAGRRLGTGYEDAGMFHEAARAHQLFAQRHRDQPDANDRLTRALCLWVQLDEPRDSELALGELRALTSSAIEIGPACQGVRPIVVPAS